MTYKLCLFLSLTLTQVFGRTENSKWIDPHSINENILYRDECNCEATEAPKEIIMSHYQRTLNLFLKSLNYHPESATYKAHVTIDLPVDEYNFIKGFSDHVNVMNEDWSRLDEILTRIFTKSKRDEFADMLVSWKELFLFHFYCKETLIFAGVLVCVVFVYNLLTARIKAGTVFKYLFLFGFVVDFAFTWIRLLQEKEVERMVNSMKYKSLPVECDPNKMGMFQYMFFKFSNDKCKEYHKTMLADDLWQVNPFKVFGTQLGDLIQTPATAIGTAFGQFTSAIAGNMSWYLAPLMPIIFIFILLMVCILLSFLTKTSFGFNFLHLIQFSFGKREKVDDALSGKHLKTLMQCLNRPTIQEIRLVPEEKKPAKQRPVLSSIEDVGTDSESIVSPIRNQGNVEKSKEEGSCEKKADAKGDSDVMKKSDITEIGSEDENVFEKVDVTDPSFNQSIYF